MVIVVVFPLPQLVVEQVNVVGDAVLVQELIELLVIDAVRTLDLTVQMRRPGADVHVAAVEGFQVPMKAGVKLGAVVPCVAAGPCIVFDRLRSTPPRPDCGSPRASNRLICAVQERMDRRATVGAVERLRTALRSPR